jgi:hypothetical protein
MDIQQRNLFRILTASIVIAILAIFSSWAVSELNPFLVMFEKGLHENAASLALGVCPETECTTNLGWGTRKLPADSSEQILERWCVEVIYNNKPIKEKGKVALEIILVNRDNDNPNNWKIVNTEYRADCSTTK